MAWTLTPFPDSECKMKTFGLVLAGGSGRRFGSDIPKQYMEIREKTVLAYALEAFQESDVDGIIIASGAQYMETCLNIAQEAGITKLISVAEGGSERYHSVMNGLRFLQAASSDAQDIVLIHDGARPFVKPDLINNVIRNVCEYRAAIAAAPCTDTIKITDKTGSIISTTDRSLTWAAQTPQGFLLEDIYHAYEYVLSGKDSNICMDKITDDAMVYQLAFPDRTVKTVLSSADNIKITRAVDIALAETILAQMKNG